MDNYSIGGIPEKDDEKEATRTVVPKTTTIQDFVDEPLEFSDTKAEKKTALNKRARAESSLMFSQVEKIYDSKRD